MSDKKIAKSLLKLIEAFEIGEFSDDVYLSACEEEIQSLLQEERTKALNEAVELVGELKSYLIPETKQYPSNGNIYYEIAQEAISALKENKEAILKLRKEGE